MAWHTASPRKHLGDLSDQEVLELALQLHRALKEMAERDPYLRETLRLQGIGDLAYSDTGEEMEPRAQLNRRLKYPWDLWANGDLWLLHRGGDYNPPLAQFQTNVHMHGYNNERVGVTRKLSEDVIAVQFVPAPVQGEQEPVTADAG
jgi:hypothetical protein